LTKERQGETPLPGKLFFRLFHSFFLPSKLLVNSGLGVKGQGADCLAFPFLSVFLSVFLPHSLVFVGCLFSPVFRPIFRPIPCLASLFMGKPLACPSPPPFGLFYGLSLVPWFGAWLGCRGSGLTCRE